MADSPERTFGWSDMFVHPDDDPRADGGFDNTERAMLVGYLADRRLTLELKCRGLDGTEMARQSVPPSDLSLLGLVRHLAGVESYWFRNVIAGETATRPFVDADGCDREFEVAADGERVEEAWATWRAEVANSDAIVAGISDMGALGAGKPVALREVMIHLIEEYARHLGHADLIRERIDGRAGQ